MSKQQIQDEILNGPLAGEMDKYVDKHDDFAIAAILNRRDVQVTRPVPIEEFVASLFETGAMLAIQTAVLEGNPTAVIADRMVSKARELGLRHIDLSIPVNQALLGGLLQAELITQAQADAATALAGVTTSRAQIVLGRDIYPAEVGNALRNP